MVDTAKYSYNSSPITNGLNNDGCFKYSFNFIRASSHLLVHWKAFHKTLKNGNQLSITIEMNLFKATTFPVKLYTSFIVFEDVISMLALTLSGFASMPR